MQVHAADRFWDGTDTTANADGGAGSWTTGGLNWDDAATAGVDTAWANNDSAIFGGTAGAVTLGGAITANALTFNTTGYTVSGNTLTLAGATPSITVTNSGQTATISSILAGTTGLTKAGAGNLTLATANTFSGNTLVSAGTLTLAETTGIGDGTGVIRGTVTVNSGAILALGTSNAVGYDTGAKLNTINLNGGSLQVNVAGVDNGWGLAWNLTGGSISGIANSRISFGGGSTFTTNASATTSTLGVNVTLREGNVGGVGTFTVADGAAATDLNVTGVISGGTGLVKEGAGLMALGASNTYTGGTVINGGSVRINSGGVSGGIRGTATVNAGTTLIGGVGDSLGYDTTAANRLTTLNLVGGTFDNAVNANQGFRTNVNLTGGTMTSTGGGKFNFTAGAGIASNASATTSLISSGIDIRNGSNLQITVADGAAAVDLRITGVMGNFIEAGGGFTKLGSGVLELTASNSHTGGTTVSAGTLLVNGGNTASGVIGAGNVTVNSGGTISLGATDNTFVGFTTNAARTIQINAGGLVTNANSSTNHLNQVVMNGGNLSVTGSANVANGNWNFDQGISTVGTVGSPTNSTISGGNAALTQVGGTNINVKGTDTLTISTALTSPAQVTNTALVKTGTGKLVLTGINTYTTTTTVNGGTLLVNGTNSGTGAVSVAGGATLGGTGSIAGAVTVTGTLAPGASVESLKTGSLTMASGSTLAVEIDSGATLSLGADMVTADSLALSGVNLTFTDLANLPQTVAENTTFTLINYGGSALTSGFIYNGNALADGDVFFAMGQDWMIDYNAITGGSNFLADQTFGNFVNLTAVPEPSAFLLSGLGALALLRRRRPNAA